MEDVKKAFKLLTFPPLPERPPYPQRGETPIYKKVCAFIKCFLIVCLLVTTIAMFWSTINPIGILLVSAIVFISVPGLVLISYIHTPECRAASLQYNTQLEPFKPYLARLEGCNSIALAKIQKLAMDTNCELGIDDNYTLYRGDASLVLDVPEYLLSIRRCRSLLKTKETI